jgi:hypothetical protein
MKTITPVSFKPAPAKIQGPTVVRSVTFVRGEVAVPEVGQTISPERHAEQLQRATERATYRPK